MINVGGGDGLILEENYMLLIRKINTPMEKQAWDPGKS